MTLNAADIMTTGIACAHRGDTLLEVARTMRDLEVGALPVCDADRRLHGIVTDRDIVIRCVADGADPQTTLVETLTNGMPTTVNTDASLAEVVRIMTAQNIRRLPVLDGQNLVGIISQADIARQGGAGPTAELVTMISSAPATS